MLVRPRLRFVAGLTVLAALFGAALTVPIPHLGDQGIARVEAEVRTRFPGWDVVQATNTWEGGYAVVASCGAREIGFQVVPGHGLPPDDAWVQPNDSYARSRLLELSDYPSFLIWRARPVISRTLSCQQELARRAGETEATQATSSAPGTTAGRPPTGIDATGRRPYD
jgi:hypothetical protein